MSIIISFKVPAPIAKPINYLLNSSDKKRQLRSKNIFETHEAEIFAKEVRKSKRLETITAFVIGSLMHAEKVLAAAPKNLGKIDIAGNTILGICRSIGYWACIIMCVIEIIKSLMQGDTKGISKIIAKYVLGFGALYVMPWIFDLIKTIFS